MSGETIDVGPSWCGSCGAPLGEAAKALDAGRVAGLQDEVARLRESIEAAKEVGKAYRGDWHDFDGRTLRYQMNDLDKLASGEWTIARYRAAVGLCPAGNGHWIDQCHDECAALSITEDTP